MNLTVYTNQDPICLDNVIQMYRDGDYIVFDCDKNHRIALKEKETGVIYCEDDGSEIII